MTDAKPATTKEKRDALTEALKRATPLGKGCWELSWDSDEECGFDGIIFRPESGYPTAPIFSDGPGLVSPNIWPPREQDRQDYELLVLLRNMAESLLADASELDTERAARLAAEARVKVLGDALTNLLAAIEGGAPVAVNTTDLWNATLAETRAALKEPANG